MNADQITFGYLYKGREIKLGTGTTYYKTEDDSEDSEGMESL